MIIYRATKQKFLEDALGSDIEEVVGAAYRERTGGGVGPSEVKAWRESLTQMAKVLLDDEIPDLSGVAIEYQIPQTRKRVDFIVTGLDAQKSARVVIIELKQWSKAKKTNMDGVILARRGGQTPETEGAHPAYQAWSYAALLESFNSEVYEGDIGLRPCAYLHNYPRDGVIDHVFYAPHIERAPLFLKGDLERKRLQTFIKQHVKHGDNAELIFRIENGKIRPSKALSESILAMLRGNQEFVLIDDQKVAYETALELARSSKEKGKHVLIVHGGPGTGKSVIAVNLLAALIGDGKNARYISKNAAPRAVYEAQLTGAYRRTQITNLFSGSGSFSETESGAFDVLIVDEAHRLNEKSGLYGNLGENQVKELINASGLTIFFVDDHQRVTFRDIGHSGELRKWASALRADVTEVTLTSQFRCNGSDGYLAWLDDALAIRKTANSILGSDEFDFRVVDSPTELHDQIEALNCERNRARVVAGYCWNWVSKRNPEAFDIEIPEHSYARRWNLSNDGSLWIISPESVSEVGCIHTCQGLELDYVGVIIGPDLSVVNGEIVTVPGRRARTDKSLHGLGRLRRSDPAKATAEADRIIKNTYRTLLTRGMRGCFVYCVDPELSKYLRARLKAPAARPAELSLILNPKPPVIDLRAGFLRRVSLEERRIGAKAVPLVDLKIAAGVFGPNQALDEDAAEWVEVPDWVQIQPGLFVAQVLGESMNRRIPNGSWCLFRANPVGTRNGKIVIAEHRSVHDPDFGGTYTIKLYSSTKVAGADAEWQHKHIRLRPDSDQPAYESILIEDADDGEFRVIAEFLAVLN